MEPTIYIVLRLAKASALASSLASYLVASNRFSGKVGDMLGYKDRGIRCINNRILTQLAPYSPRNERSEVPRITDLRGGQYLVRTDMADEQRCNPWHCSSSDEAIGGKLGYKDNAHFVRLGYTRLRTLQDEQQNKLLCSES